MGGWTGWGGQVRAVDPCRSGMGWRRFDPRYVRKSDANPSANGWGPGRTGHWGRDERDWGRDERGERKVRSGRACY